MKYRVNSISTLKEWLEKGALTEAEYLALIQLPFNRDETN